MVFRRIALLFCFLAVLAATAPALDAAQTVKLAWDASASGDVVGYRILSGNAPGSYTNVVEVGNVTTATLSNLTEGTSYYFAVIAYNGSLAESDASNEIAYSTPGVAPTPTPNPTATPTPVPTATPIPTATPTPNPSATPAPVGSPAIAVSATQVSVGSTVRATVSNGFAESHDLVAVLDRATGAMADWFYLNGTKTAPANGMSGATVTFPMNAAGQYQFLFFSNYAVVATSPLVTVSGSASPTPTPVPVPTATPIPTPTPIATPTPTPIPGSFSSVSTRANVTSGDNVLIGGLVLSGTQPKKVLLRAMGPSLSAYGVAGTLRDPVLEIHNSTGALVALNDNWSANAAAINSTGRAPGTPEESAIVTTLTPGAYTAIVSGAAGAQGVALVELYDLEPEKGRLASISTRGKVGVNDNVMIGGFSIGGEQSTRVVVRAIGPSMAAYGVSGLLIDPVLELYNSSGSQIFTNDNWKAEQQAEIAASGLAPSDARESAIIATLPPGAYTAVVRGARNLTGVALVEVYYVGL